MAFFDLPLSELETYRPSANEPADFDLFWSQTLAEHPFDSSTLTFTPAAPYLRSVAAYDVTFRGFGGQPIHAWYLQPVGGPEPWATVVDFPGYGGGRDLPGEHLEWVAAGYNYLRVDVRGQGGNWGSGGSTDDPGPAGRGHPGFMTRGIESPETYFYRRAFVDAHHAIEAAACLPGAGRIVAAGGSQGGALTIAATALNPRVWAALPDVPFLSCFPRAVGLTNAFPYQEIVEYLSVNRDRVEQTFATLAYFDTVNLGARATAPALFSVGLMDEVTPPSTVFAAKNSYGGPAEIKVYPFNGHEGGGGHQVRAQMEWLAERRG